MSTTESRLQQLQEELDNLKSSLESLKEDIDKVEIPTSNNTFTEKEVIALLETAYDTGFNDCYDEAMNTDYSLRYHKDVVTVEVEISGDEFFRYEPLDGAHNKEIQVEKIMERAVISKIPIPQSDYSIL
jgi:sugar-specific transcriptional regulator TrmB